MRSRRPANGYMIGCALAVLALASCQTGSDSDNGSSPIATTTPAAAIAEHEAGPESPLAYGLIVPDGATQLGPLARSRSEQMIEAYQSELVTALAAQGVREAVRAANNNPDGVAQPEAPPIVKSGRPDDDTFALLEEPPGADITAAVVRLDRDPSAAVASMVQQIAEILPDAGVDPDDLASYCTVEDERVASCKLEAEGTTEDDRELAIAMYVDPGDVATRTAPPSSQMRPVMEIRIEDRSDPRVPRTDVARAPEVPESGGDASDRVVWPAMDLEAPQDTSLLYGWVRPEGATMLLSSFDPGFVSLYVPRAADAREIARSYVSGLAPGVAVTTDSYEGLNEVDVTFSATAPDGSRAVGTHVITARGNYVMLFHTPPQR